MTSTSVKRGKFFIVSNDSLDRERTHLEEITELAAHSKNLASLLPLAAEGGWHGDGIRFGSGAFALNRLAFIDQLGCRESSPLLANLDIA